MAALIMKRMAECHMDFWDVSQLLDCDPKDVRRVLMRALDGKDVSTGRLAMIAGAVWLTPHMAEPVMALGWAVLIAGALQLAIQTGQLGGQGLPLLGGELQGPAPARQQLPCFLHTGSVHVSECVQRHVHEGLPP